MSQFTHFPLQRKNLSGRPVDDDPRRFACDFCAGREFYPTEDGQLETCPECRPFAPMTRPDVPVGVRYLRDHEFTVRRLARMLCRFGEPVSEVYGAIVRAIVFADPSHFRSTFGPHLSASLEKRVRAHVESWRAGREKRKDR